MRANRPRSTTETRDPEAGGEAKRSQWARDESLASTLWDRSEELTGVTFTL